jgi:hypothetical protein
MGEESKLTPPSRTHTRRLWSRPSWKWMRRGMANHGGANASWARSELFAGVSCRDLAGPTAAHHSASSQASGLSARGPPSSGARGADEEDAAARAMREENDALIDELDGKVSRISRGAHGISSEVRTSMEMLQSVVCPSLQRPGPGRA